MFHIFLSIIFLSQETRWERCGSYGKRRRIHRDHHLLWSCFSRSSAWIDRILLLSLKSSRFELLDMLSLPCVFCSKRYRPNSATFRISMFLRRFFTVYMSSERDSTELLLKHYTITFQLHPPSSLKPWVFFACPLPPCCNCWLFISRISERSYRSVNWSITQWLGPYQRWTSWRVGWSQWANNKCLRILKTTREIWINWKEYIYIYVYVSESVLHIFSDLQTVRIIKYIEFESKNSVFLFMTIRKFPHIYLSVKKYGLDIPKMNLHDKKGSKRVDVPFALMCCILVDSPSARLTNFPEIETA